ncbi:non-specific lipid-transfer protein-like protein At2g13820 [Asparagus officinalis]|uniref:non-specific lipid-transfer protein-like protein At2g13820 n=1 Tax=Asparagus officinalis TaxID=4686 RepID=UPI00098DE295|nr:non-specific lipid-transfer protein-like protein At2g13820 [Asparagus officinalis]
MAQRVFSMSLVLVLVAIMSAQTMAQTGCTPTNIAGLSPCLGFITGNSSAPSSACCTQLASVVQTQAQCLCVFLNGAPQLPIAINQTQALTLPGACNIQAPPLSQCKASGAGSPQGAPSPASPTTPSAATGPSQSSPSVPTPTTPSNPSNPSTPAVPSTPSGSKTVPTAGQAPSAGSSIKFAPSILFLVFLASALSSF